MMEMPTDSLWRSFVHIVASIKQVPDTTQVRIDPETNTLIREGVPSIINPFDVHAIEEAVRLKERYGGKVTIISMGPPQAAEALRKAMSSGADEVILASDRAFAGADTLATSAALTAIIRRVSQDEPVDLVLCGKQTIDGDTAQVGPGIASRLNYAQLTYVDKIESVDLEARRIRVRRHVEGAHEVLEAPLPAVLTLLPDINEPRYASLPSLVRALRHQVPVWTHETVALDPKTIGLNGSPTQVRRIFAPPRRGRGEILPGGSDDPDAAAAALVERLAGAGFLD
jgi:electron transfer flavoprotein beta subunit